MKECQITISTNWCKKCYFCWNKVNNSTLLMIYSKRSRSSWIFFFSFRVVLRRIELCRMSIFGIFFIWYFIRKLWVWGILDSFTKPIFRKSIPWNIIPLWSECLSKLLDSSLMESVSKKFSLCRGLLGSVSSDLVGFKLM